MLPLLPATSLGNAGAEAVAVPPPPRFRAPLGNIQGVTLGPRSPLGIGTSSAQKAGLRYEAKVLRELEQRFPHILLSPEIYFYDDRGENLAVPDAVLPQEHLTVVIEVKYQHMPEAWWQLRKKYEPIIRYHFKNKTLLLEVCRSYDAHMPFPEAHNLYESIDDFFLQAKDGDLGVLQWKL